MKIAPETGTAALGLPPNLRDAGQGLSGGNREGRSAQRTEGIEDDLQR